jgi:hypothetical protein
VLSLYLFVCWSVFAVEQAITSSQLDRSRAITERFVGLLQKDHRSEKIYIKIITGIDRVMQKTSIDDATRASLALTKESLVALKEKRTNTRYKNLVQEFRDTYATGMTSPEIQKWLEQCFVHYPVVDGFAQRVGKPTPLLLAMWFIESSCAMNNPANRDGIFQIIANDYTPGPLALHDLIGQLQDFETFMAGKWKWYYSKNPNAPHDLWHTMFTYDALQTFAALYNGIDLEAGYKRYPLLNGNPYYFLSGSSPEYKGKKDGLLVLFVKLAKMEEEWLKK